MTSIQEDVHYDGGPARGDLIFNILLGFTLIGLPFTIGAVVRALWLRFRITSRRISVTGGWMGKDKTQVGVLTDQRSAHRAPGLRCMGRHGVGVKRRRQARTALHAPIPGS